MVEWSKLGVCVARLCDYGWKLSNPGDLSVSAEKTVSEIHELYRRMKELAVQQRDMLSENHMDRFIQLLARRKRIKQDIIDTERQWNLLSDKKGSTSISPQHEMWRTKIKAIITEILHVDRDIRHVLAKERKDLLAHINGLRGGQKALQGYGHRTAKSPKFVDRSE